MSTVYRVTTKWRSRSPFGYVCMYKSVLFARQRFPDLLLCESEEAFWFEAAPQTHYRKSVPNDSDIFKTCRYQYCHHAGIDSSGTHWQLQSAPLLSMPSYLDSLRVIQKEYLSNSIYMCFLCICTHVQQ